MTSTRCRIMATSASLALAVAAVVSTTSPALALDLLPPVAIADSLTTPHDRTRVVPAPGVLGNDLDLDGGTKAILVSGTSHGSVTLRSDGGYTYVPAAGYVGPDQFRYRASSGLLDSLVATVSINVTNARPVARPDAYSVAAGKPKTVAAAGVLTNDSDGDGDTLSAQLVATTSHGSLSLEANGGFTYLPNAAYAGSDSFSYRAWDGVQWSDAATVSLTVIPPPTPAPTPAPTPTPTRPPSPQPKPTSRPSVTGHPSPTPSRTATPSNSPAAGPVVPGGGSTGPGGGEPSAPTVDVPRLQVRFTDTLVGDFDVLTGVEWAVPGLALVAPGLLLIIIALLMQGFVGAVWVAFSRRRLRGIGMSGRSRA
jgi:hypothetical protein